MFKRGVERLREIEGLEVVVSVTGSESNRSKALCREDWIIYTEFKNNPLGAKMNQAAIQAEQTNADYYLLMGSDDVIGTDLMKLYLKYLDEGYEYLYLLDCYFYDIKRKCGLYWGGYRMSNNHGHPAGIGRVLTKDLMKKMEFQPWYDVKMSGLLDQAMNEKMAQLRPKARAIHCLSEGVFALDIKSDENMTQFDLWDNTVTFNGKFLYNKLPQEEADKIYHGK
jgi:GT2 family glycosyltransferase